MSRSVSLAAKAGSGVRRSSTLSGCITGEVSRHGRLRVLDRRGVLTEGNLDDRACGSAALVAESLEDQLLRWWLWANVCEVVGSAFASTKTTV